jgi:predicted  nucleic acid-binding Zn-ribbon protein
MSVEWVERLSGAVDFRQLREVYDQMSAAVEAGGDAKALIAAIDDAIRRLVQEKARDQAELEKVRTDYDGFKSEQAGFFGWIKRHVPFGETRSQELTHRSTISDQEAEILADNFVIARAQMLKERLLPEDMRHSGRPVEQWRGRLAASEAADANALRAYGQTLMEIRRELGPLKAFVKEVAAEITAFAATTFSQSEDQRRKDADVKAAQAEVAAFQGVAKDKEGLWATGLTRAGGLVEMELSCADGAYRGLIERIATLDHLAGDVGMAKRKITELLSAVKQGRELSTKLADLPKRRHDIQNQADAARKEADDWRRRFDSAMQQMSLQGPARQTAYDELQRAAGALESARRVAESERAAAGDGGAESPAAAAELARAQQTHTAAEARYRSVSGPFDASKSEHDQADGRLRALQGKLDDLKRQHDQLEREENQTRTQLQQAQADLESRVAQVAPAAAAYGQTFSRLGLVSAIQRATVHGPTPWRTDIDGPSFGPTDPGRSLKAAEDYFQGLSKNIHEDDATISREQALARQRRGETWLSRCRELLGSDLAQEVAAVATPK